MAEQVLVTGGTGFIGRHLVRRLLANGRAVRVFTRQPGLATELFGGDAEIHGGDLCDAAAVTNAMPRGGVVYHLGGLYRFGPQHRRAMRDTNREGTRNVLCAASARQIGRIVHVSTAGLLYRPEGLIESGDFQKPPAGCHYKRSKWEAERLALKAAEDGLPVIIASPTCPIGPEDTSPTPTGRMIRDFIARRFAFSCSAGLNLIGVGDLAEGLAAAAEHGKPGKRYLLGYENLSLDGFLRLLEKATGIPAPTKQVPQPLLCAAGLAGEGLLAAGLGFPGCPHLCWETAVYAARRQYFNMEPTSRELGWKATTSLATSLEATLAWLNQGEAAQPATATLAAAAT
jgi:dihydroflavonol-4-reductase